MEYSIKMQTYIMKQVPTETFCIRYLKTEYKDEHSQEVEHRLN